MNIKTQDSLKGWTLNFRDYIIEALAWTKSNEKVDVYTFVENEIIFHKRTGGEYPKRDRDFKEKWVLNRVSLDEILPKKDVTILIKVKGTCLGYPPFFKLNIRSPLEKFYHEIYS